MSSKFIKPLVLLTLALLIPFLPFVSFGHTLEVKLDAWMKQQSGSWVLDASVAGLLATDILLPIPSSMISTVGAMKLGVVRGTLASWIGMSVGAVLGFALARWLGRPLAERLSGRAELDRMEGLSQRFGPTLLVLTRAVPLLAEASVLLFGATGLSWRRFLLPVVAANLGISLAYAVFGDFAERHQSLPIALAISIALPVLAAMLAKRWLPAKAPSQ